MTDQTAKPRQVVAAAIIHAGVLYTLPRPARHGDLVKHISENHPNFRPPVHAGANQGFVDERGWFMGREEAMFVALQSGQLTVDPESSERILFSEDLW